MSDAAIDSSILIAFINGEKTDDMDILHTLITKRQAFLPPVTLSEVLSYPRLTTSQIETISVLPILPVEDGYWQRTGAIRRLLLSKGLKSHLPDALIAQSCIDHAVPLLTRDSDFRHYAEHGGLKLLVP
jgi:predicted nucleic acid-binding protein